MMTADELKTLDGIAAAIHRIEVRQESDGLRLDRLDKLADRVEGALTFAKWLTGFVGLGGIVALLFAVKGH